MGEVPLYVDGAGAKVSTFAVVGKCVKPNPGEYLPPTLILVHLFDQLVTLVALHLQ